MLLPASVINDMIVTIASWEYLIQLLVIQPKTSMHGHHVILGMPWLAIVDAFIGCRYGEMTISNGISMKNVILYPPAQLLYNNHCI